MVLRSWQDADADALYAAVRESTERIAVWMPWPQYHRTADDTREYIRHSHARFTLREEFGWGLFDRASGDVLGAVGLHPRDWSVPVFEIGYWLRDAAEGHGYVSEAVRRITAYCFDTLAARRVFIRCDARNTRSAAVPERLGFVHEATLRQDSLGMDGTPRDTLIWAMIPDDYARARASWP